MSEPRIKGPLDGWWDEDTDEVRTVDPYFVVPASTLTRVREALEAGLEALRIENGCDETGDRPMWQEEEDQIRAILALLETEEE